MTDNDGDRSDSDELVSQDRAVQVEPIPNGTSGATATDPALASWGNEHEYAIRMGLFMLKSENNKHPTEQFHGRLCDALRADSRVQDFNRPAYRPDWSPTYKAYPAAVPGRDVHEMLRDEDHFGNARFGDPLIFSVVVPRENQPSFRGESHIPTDRYAVAWDGLLLCVLWEQNAQTTVSKAAARVVYDVVNSAATKAGTGLYVQACSPGCKNLFLHTDVLLVGAEPHPAKHPQLAVYHMSRLASPLDEVQNWYARCRTTFDAFGRMKNKARRILDLESVVRGGLEDCLKTRQEREHRRSMKPLKRAEASWASRHWQREMSKDLSDLWLGIAQMEALSREWTLIRRRFAERASYWDIVQLFSQDAQDDEIAIESIDLALIRAAIENSSTRLDARILNLATAMAAGSGLLGGGFGALLTAVLT